MKAEQRPLSPFMIGPYYKPQLTSLMSITHRASGVFLSVVGAPLLLWWIVAMSSGPEAYETLLACLWQLDRQAGPVGLPVQPEFPPPQRDPPPGLGYRKGARYQERLHVRLAGSDGNCHSDGGSAGSVVMSMVNPLARARGTGSAKEGVHHWYAQRATAHPAC